MVHQFAEFELRDAEEMLEASARDLEQTARLHESGFVSESELRSAKIRLQRAEARVKLVRDAMK